VLFLRVNDANAWLLALVFGGFLVGAPIFREAVSSSKVFEGLIHPAWLRAVFVSFEGVFWAISPGLFNYFFAVFPNRSPLDRRLPWLKWLLLIVLAAFVAPISYWIAKAGFVPVMVILKWLGDRAASVGGPWRLVILFPLLALGSLLLGLASLVSNGLRPVSSEARRKIRVMMWGTVAGTLPVIVIGVPYLTGPPPQYPLWVFLVAGFMACLIPASLGYAVVKHRVLDIPVLLKRSVRYLLVKRGFAVFLVFLFACANALFTLSYLHFFRAVDVGLAIAMGVSFGALLLWVSAPVVKRTTERIDRAFFRGAYDARQVLENLASSIRRATRREQLAALLEGEIKQALHPTTIAVHLEGRDGRLGSYSEGVPRKLEPVLLAEPLLEELARRGEPFEILPEQIGDSSLFGSIKPECLVPMVGADGHLTGVVLLGPRLSEESYSREDKRLLASVASQAGIALESIRRGEEIAERIEGDRRAAQEMEFARQVQARLFPQKFPSLETLEYAGGCIQARQVGGDYYDFLELRPGRLAMVLADVAGKGVSGALLMANLQANLRSQYALALDDTPRFLGSVNRLFFENGSDSSYATLFFADYDDATRRLRYVNCGHPAPLLLRAPDRSRNRDSCAQVERLEATSTVLGLFDQWECSIAEVQLAPGDTLVLYTDGVTEATNPAAEEFGESRILEALEAHRNASAASLLQAIVQAVSQFGGREQADDITLIVARCKAC
jgi:serine phosphatase RsbU (regulator of sigma subunit)